MVHIILLGPPGSGKGTQTRRLVQAYHFAPISVGEILREQIVNNTQYKSIIERYVNYGQLAPNDIVFNLVEQLIQKYHATHSLVFDGFPRTRVQVTMLNDLLLKYQIELDGIIFLEVAYVTLFQRLKQRAILEKRVDDQEESRIQTRIDIYAKETLPIVNYYQDSGKLYRVDGAQMVDQVTIAINSIVDQLYR